MVTKVKDISARTRTRIGVLLINEFALMSFASVVEPFRAANLIAGEQLYEVLTFASSGSVAISSFGVQVQSYGDILKAGKLDFVFVVAGGNQKEILEAPVAPILRHLDKMGVVLGGVSGGPLLLASAGLMEGRRMTVHWEHAPALSEISPTLLIERSLYVIDRNRVTCAGGTAPMDMIHSLIAKLHGNEFARKVSDWFMHTDIRPSAGAQRSGIAERYGTKNQTVLDTVEMMQNHVADTLPLTRLAEFAGVSPRQLNRLFHQELAVTTMAFYLELRLDLAKNLLRNTSLPVTEVALASGFSNPAHFSTAFRKNHGVSPSKLANS